MNLSISACKAPHWRANAFESAIHGPKLTQFHSRSYGSAVDTFSIILETQTPTKTLRHYTRYHPEDRWFYCHFVLDDDALEAATDSAAFHAIASTILAALKKSLRKLKNKDFNAELFQSDLSAYFDQIISTNKTNATVA
jgi:hypothetical protein